MFLVMLDVVYFVNSLRD